MLLLLEYDNKFSSHQYFLKINCPTLLFINFVVIIDLIGKQCVAVSVPCGGVITQKIDEKYTLHNNIAIPLFGLNAGRACRQHTERETKIL